VDKIRLLGRVREKCSPERSMPHFAEGKEGQKEYLKAVAECPSTPKKCLHEMIPEKTATK